MSKTRSSKVFRGSPLKKVLKTSGFLTLSGGIKIENWLEMGYKTTRGFLESYESKVCLWNFFWLNRRMILKNRAL